MDSAEFSKRGPGNGQIPAGISSRDTLVREQLERILQSPGFQGANRRVRLLRYLVERTLEERGDTLKESVIAAEVFDRGPDFDPQVDSAVRVEVGRLRSRLTEFYGQNPDEPVRIEIPKGSYRPAWVVRDDARERATEGQAENKGAARSRGWKWAAAIAVVAVAAIAGWIWRARVSNRRVPASIAVLPFLNLSGNAADDYFADGITDELTELVAEFADLRVVARTSAFQYKGKGTDVREIGRNLGVGAVLEGSAARQSDGKIRVIAQLIRTSDGSHLWSHTYNGEPGELAEMEAGIARASREKLGPAASPLREAGGSRNPEAHDLYIRAVYEFNQRTVASTREAIDLARQAAAKDGSFAQPYVLMASAESQLNTQFVQAPDVSAKHEWEDVGQALKLDPGNSAAHALKALLAYTDQWDWPQAEREFGLALAGGSHGAAENNYGWCLMTRGRFAEARRRLQTAVELDPLSLGPQLNQVAELIEERNDAEAKRKLDHVLQVAPGSPAALALALRLAFWRKDCASASAFGQKIGALYRTDPGRLLVSAATSAACGETGKTAETLQVLAKAQPSDFASPYQAAGIFAIGNDDSRAMSYLELAAERREPALLQVKVDRAFERLHQEPRFIALERRLGLLE